MRFILHSPIIILNQIANPFNESLESDLEHFISTGGLFGIVSAQIWKFTPSFHTLFGLEVPSQGPREFPQGNLSTNISVELINQSFLDIVDPSHPILSMEGCIGISSSVDQFKEIASIQTASGDAAITAFSHTNGFSFALPFSPVEVSLAIENTSQLIGYIIEVGFNYIRLPFSLEFVQEGNWSQMEPASL